MRSCKTLMPLLVMILMIACSSVYGAPGKGSVEAENGKISISFTGKYYEDTEVQCRDARTGKLKWRYRGNRYFFSAKISPRGDTVLVNYSRTRPEEDGEGYVDSTMMFDMSGHVLWDRWTGGAIWSAGEAVISATWKYLLVDVAYPKSKLRVYRARDGVLLWERKFNHDRQATSSFTRDEKHVFSYSGDDLIMYGTNGKREWSYSAHPGYIESASTSDDGSMSAVIKGDDPLVVTFGPHGQVINKAVPNVEVGKSKSTWWNTIIVSSDGRFALLESAVGDPYVGFDSTGKQIWTFTPPDWDKSSSLAGMRALPSGEIAIDHGYGPNEDVKSFIVNRDGKLVRTMIRK